MCTLLWILQAASNFFSNPNIVKVKRLIFFWWFKMPSRRLTLTVLPHTGVNFFCSLILLRIFDNTHPKRRSKKNINGDDNFSPPPPHFPFPFTAQEDNLISVPAWKNAWFFAHFRPFASSLSANQKKVFFCGEITVCWIMVRKWDASGTSCPSDGIAPSSSSSSKKPPLKHFLSPCMASSLWLGDPSRGWVENRL